MKLPEYPRMVKLYHLEVDGNSTIGTPKVGQDNTDHFYFRCNCGRKAQVVRICATNYKGLPELYFTTRCRQCGTIGTRKIWVGEVIG